MLCDAVVELDKAGVIVKPAPSLANFLQLSRAGALQGTAMQDLLQEHEDRDIFSGMMQASANGVEMAITRHVNMVTEGGMFARVQLFIVSAADSNMGCLLGIVESVDFTTPVHHAAPQCRRDPEGEDSDNDVSREGPARPVTLGNQDPRASDEETKRSMSSASTGQLSELRHASGMMPTWSKAIDVSLLNTMQSWRCGAKESRACCALHAAAHELAKAAKRVAKCHCKLHFKCNSTWQCRRCGIADEVVYLNEEDGACMLCEDIEEQFPALKEEDGRRRHGTRHRFHDQGSMRQVVRL